MRNWLLVVVWSISILWTTTISTLFDLASSWNDCYCLADTCIIDVFPTGALVEYSVAITSPLVSKIHNAALFLLFRVPILFLFPCPLIMGTINQIVEIESTIIKFFHRLLLLALLGASRRHMQL